MLGDIVKHLTPDRTFEEYYGKLHGIMSKLLTIVDDFPSLFAMVRERGKRLFAWLLSLSGQDLTVPGFVPTREYPSRSVQIDSACVHQ